MDEPAAVIQSGSASAALRRSTEAILSGCVIDIAGLPVRVHAADETRAVAVAALLRGVGRHSAPPAAELCFRVEGLEPPPSDPSEVYDDLALWRSSGTLWIRHRSGVIGRATARDVVLGGGEGDLRVAFRRVFQFVVTHLLAAHDRFVLHAGAIELGRGVALTFGSTGVGKSTLAMAALNGGWPVLSDDLTVVQVRDGGLDACGIPRPLSVPGDVGAGVAGALALDADARSRWELPPERLAAGWHRVSAVIAVRHGDTADATIEPMAQGTAMQAGLASFLSTLDPATVRTFFPVAGTLARLPAWSLCHGTDPARRLESASRCLNELADALRS